MDSEQGWTGRKDRHPVIVDAVVLRTDGSKIPVTLTDFSDKGCCIQAENDFHIGERLRIAIPRMGHVRAQVRWVKPDSAGAKFVVETDF